MEDFGESGSNFLALHESLELYHNPGEREESVHKVVNAVSTTIAR